MMTIIFKYDDDNHNHYIFLSYGLYYSVYNPIKAAHAVTVYFSKGKQKKVERFWSTRKKNNMTSSHFVLYTCLEMHMVTHNTEYPDYALTMSLETAFGFYPPDF